MGQEWPYIPAFQSGYMLSGVKQWIFHGIWDRNFIQKEIIAAKERAIPRSPAEMIKSLRVMDIDDAVLQDSFSDFLVMAYSGILTLEEYPLLRYTAGGDCAWLFVSKKTAIGKYFSTRGKNQNVLCRSYGRIYQGP